MKFDQLKLSTARGALLLTAAISTFAMVGRAEACTVGGVDNGSASNVTVDCSGATDSSAPDGIAGYGTFQDNNNTYNIQEHATVTGTSFGLRMGTGNTVHNSGTVTGANDTGISAFGADTTTIVNTSTGKISGHNGIAANVLDLHNAGRIEAIDSTGAAGDTAVRAADATIVNDSSGVITGGNFGINASTVIVTNDGLIEATKGGGGAIRSVFDLTVKANTGTIQAIGTGGIAIQSLAGTVTITSNSNLIKADLNAISAKDVVVTGNSGIIEATGTNGIAINAANTATVNNLSGGKIQALGSGGIGIVATTVTVTGNADTIAGDVAGIFAHNADSSAGSADVTNSNLITGRFAGIVAINDVKVANSGTIEGTGAGGSFAIDAELGAINVTSNSGTIQATAPGGIAINASTTATVSSNSHLITADVNAINATDVIVNGNSGTIEATATDGSAAAILAHEYRHRGQFERRHDPGAGFGRQGHLCRHRHDHRQCRHHRRRRRRH